MILNCTYMYAPIASQDRHFTPYSGEVTAKEKIKFYHHSDSVCRARVRADEICLANDISYLSFMEEQSICIK